MNPQHEAPVGAFWSSNKIREELEKRTIRIEPGNPDPLNPEDATYKLAFGGEAYVSGAKEKAKLEGGDIVTVEPGQMALLLTEETVTLPRNVLGFISLRTSYKVPGLINVSGFHVDPGFHGQLIFTVYNAGTETVAFARGDQMFLLWFTYLTDFEKGERKGKRKRQNQDRIPATDISRLTTEGASPAHLRQRIERLEIMGKVYGALLLAFFLAVATLLIRGAFDRPQQAPLQEAPPAASAPANQN